jgi:hypothetical protein
MHRPSLPVVVLGIVTWSVLTTLAIAQPSPRANADMAYDSESALFLLFGMQNTTPGDENAETWVFDPSSATWEQRFLDPTPPARGANALAYDAQSDRVVLFGGAGGDDAQQVTDLWSYDANADR